MGLQLIAIGLVILIGSLTIDVLFGEPRPYIHPVIMVRRITARLDSRFRSMKNKINAGALFLIFILLITTIPIFLLVYVSKAVTLVYVIASIIVLKGTFSITSVTERVNPVIEALEKGSISEARIYLSRLVRRRTEDLDVSQISSAAVEAISKSLIYGVVAPLFYFSIFGILGAFVTRMINAMDLAIGTKDRQNYEFGRFTAVTHTIINYIPSRISSFLIIFSSEMLNYRVQSIPLRNVRSLPESTNTGWSMGAMATSLNIRLEKIGSYILNEDGFEPTVGDIKRALNVYYISIYTFIIVILIPLMVIVLYLLGFALL